MTLDETYPDSDLASQFQIIAKLIAARGDLGTERQVFFAQIGGFDTHSDVGDVLDAKMKEINEALTPLVAELGGGEEGRDGLGVWEDVAILTASDFGRTLTSNGKGSDHAWAGHHLLLGGGLDGKKIVGEYPADLTEDGELNIGRGRLVPTMPWEGVWHAVSQWFGVDDDSTLRGVLPNLWRFQDPPNSGRGVLAKADLFDERRRR